MTAVVVEIGGNLQSCAIVVGVVWAVAHVRAKRRGQGTQIHIDQADGPTPPARSLDRRGEHP